MIERPRLIPAVILGAMGLLALKLLAWTAEPYPGTIPSSPSVFAEPKPQRATGKRSADGQAADNLTTGTQSFRDPETTGSNPAPEPKKEQEKADAEAKVQAARDANPANKAGIVNGTKQAVSPSEKALLERLGERREEIETRMRELDMREKLLDTAEKKLDGRLGDLKSLEEKVDGNKAKPADEEAKAVKNLVIMYEAMKPKDAARVFDRLGLDILVPVVQQMNPRKMSDVLAAMSAERAEKLTVALAMTGRGGAERASADLAPLPGNELPAIAPARRR